MDSLLMFTQPTRRCTPQTLLLCDRRLADMFRFWQAKMARMQCAVPESPAGRGCGKVTVRLNQWGLGALDESLGALDEPSSSRGATPSEVMNRALQVYAELRR